MMVITLNKNMNFLMEKEICNFELFFKSFYFLITKMTEVENKWMDKNIPGKQGYQQYYTEWKQNTKRIILGQGQQTSYLEGQTQNKKILWPQIFLQPLSLLQIAYK